MSITTLRQHASTAVGEVGGRLRLITAEADACSGRHRAGTAATGGVPSGPGDILGTVVAECDIRCRWSS